jgi:hypothetical protein
VIGVEPPTVLDTKLAVQFFRPINPRAVWVPGLLIDIAALVSGGYRKFLF